MTIPGVTIALGGRDWVVPPLTLGQLRRLMPQVRRLSSVGAAMGEEEIGIVLDVVATALARNYPEMTGEKAAELVDLGNVREVLTAILAGSGLRPPGNAAGEAGAVARPGGPKSTASSPPPAATATRSSTR
jgi:hypothetical protein